MNDYSPINSPISWTAVLLCLLCSGVIMACASPVKSVQPSDHFNGRRFFNPQQKEHKGFFSLLKWWVTGDAKPWPDKVPNRGRPSLEQTFKPGELALTFINHSTFLLQFPGVNILTDPIFSKRASPVTWAGPKRVRPPGVALDQLPTIHVVLISHNHYDHMDLPALKKLQVKFAPQFLVPIGEAERLSQEGLKNIVEMDWWQTQALATGGEVIMTPARHFSGRTPFDRDHSLWGGFVIKRAGLQVFFAGDTGYASHFREVREKFGTSDLALLPIGAYEPRWFMQEMHMNPADAAQAHLDLRAKFSVGMHFGTFPLTDEGLVDPPGQLLKDLTKKQIDLQKFIVMDEGQTLKVGGQGQPPVN